MKKSNGFIKLDRFLWQSDQWRNLSVNAQITTVDIWARFNGRNNGQIVYDLRDAIARLHCSKRTAIRMLAELQDAGLIEATVKGSFQYKTGARKGTATEWRLTFLPSPNRSNE